MSWYGVITDVGRNLIAQYISGTAQIDVNRMTVGSGRVSEENMKSSTALVQTMDTGSIVSKKNVDHGIDFMLQIGPRSGGAYEATEIGIWANAVGADGVLLMLLQNNTGVPIPAAGASVDFAYMLGVLLIIDNLENISVTIDSSAYVPYAVFNPYCEDVATQLNGKVDKVDGKGLSTNDYTTADKDKLSGIESQANKYVLPKATGSVLGGVKVGTGLNIDNNGVLSNSAVRAVTTGTANGTISVNTDGTSADVAVKGLKSAAYQEASAFAQGSHTHSASAITDGILPVTRGGTGISSNPSMKVSLGSTNAASVFATDPRPGVDGTLGTGNGGTGITFNPAMIVNLGSTSTDSVFKQDPKPGVTGTLPVTKGGTGMGSNPSMKVNLASTSAANVFAQNPQPGVTGKLGIANGGTGLDAAPKLKVELSSQAEASIFTSQPRPGVTGKLPIANGGTNGTTAEGARSQLGAAAASHKHSITDLTQFDSTLNNLNCSNYGAYFRDLAVAHNRIQINGLMYYVTDVVIGGIAYKILAYDTGLRPG